jgi:hypothetical protein
MSLIQLVATTIEADRRRESDRNMRARIVEQAMACCERASAGLRRRFASRIARLSIVGKGAR